MKPIKPDNRFDELITGTIGREMITSDFDAWKLKHQKEIRQYESQITNRRSPSTIFSKVIRLIIKNKITKPAVAAVIIIGILVIMNYFGGSPDGAKVAWAGLADRVQNIQTVVYHISSENDPLIGISYFSDRYGFRGDGFVEDGSKLSDYILTANKISLTLKVTSKTYYRREMDDEAILKELYKMDPRQWINEYMAQEYRELGRKTIDGIEVEGIEVEGHHLEDVRFENCRIGLWVDVENGLPVRMEKETIAVAGYFKTKIIYDEFQWGVELDESVFTPDLTGYTLLTRPPIAEVSLENALEGLRLFADQARGRHLGRYPSSLAGWTVVMEAHAICGIEFDNFYPLKPLCLLYEDLVEDKKEVAYYGDKITAYDADKVLWRWKVADYQYQVVYGDLYVETVDSQRLAEIESRSVIDSLKGYAELTGGKYPSKLVYATAEQEYAAAFRARIEQSGVKKNPTHQEVQTILNTKATCRYYAQLLYKEKDPAYYGDKVTAEDFDKVLLRWKVGPEKYWVIFGDLHVETIDSKRLAELEGR